MITGGEESTSQMLDQIAVQGKGADSTMGQAQEVFIVLQTILDLYQEITASAEQLLRLDETVAAMISAAAKLTPDVVSSAAELGAELGSRVWEDLDVSASLRAPMVELLRNIEVGACNGCMQWMCVVDV